MVTTEEIQELLNESLDEAAIEALLKLLRHRDIQITGLKESLAAKDGEIAKLRKQEKAVCKAVVELEEALGLYTGDDEESL